MLREMDFIESDWAALFWAIGSVKSLTLSRKGSGIMHGQQINRVSGKVVIVLSLIALLTVFSGYFQPPQPDEGAAAHDLSAVNRGAGTDDLAFLRHSGLDKTFAKRTNAGFSSSCFGSRVCCFVLP